MRVNATTNSASAANVNALAANTNTRGTSFFAALVQSVHNQTATAQTVAANRGTVGNTAEGPSSTPIAAHAATAQTPPVLRTSDAGSNAKAGAKARPLTASTMAGEKPNTWNAATAANLPTVITTPEQCPCPSNILAASAGQGAEPRASVDPSNTSPTLLAVTLTPVDAGAAAATIFSPVQNSIDMGPKNPTATTTASPTVAAVADLSSASAARSISPVAAGSSSPPSATTAAFNPMMTSPAEDGDAAISFVPLTNDNGTASSAGVRSTNDAFPGLSRASSTATSALAAENAAHPAPALSPSDETRQVAPPEIANDPAAASTAAPLVFDAVIAGSEPLPATGGTSSAAPSEGNAAAGGNELFSVINDAGRNGLPHDNTAVGDAPHLPVHPASPATVLSAPDPVLSTGTVVIPSSFRPAFDAAINSTALPEEQTPLHSPLASGTGTDSAAKAAQTATTFTLNKPAITEPSTPLAGGISSVVFDRGRDRDYARDHPSRLGRHSEKQSAANASRRRNLAGTQR